MLLLNSLRVCGDTNQGMLTSWQFLKAGTQILGVCAESVFGEKLHYVRHCPGL